MANLIGIVQSAYFLWGIALGGLGLVLSLPIARGRAGNRPLGLGGAIISAATVAAVGVAGQPSGRMWVGLALILAGTGVSVRLGVSRAAIALASVPGAIAIALAVPAEPGWVRPLVVVATPVLGYLSDDFESRYGDRGFGIVFFGLAAMGTFLAVPDTEFARALFAVCLVMSLTAWPRPALALGRSGAYMAISVFVVFSAVGGVGRPASVLPALACLGYLVIEPMAVRARPTLERLPGILHKTPEAAILAAVPQFALVLVVSRVAAPHHSIGKAAGVALVAVAIAYLLLIWAEKARLPDLAGTPTDV